MVRKQYLFELEKQQDNIVTFALKDTDIKAYVFILEEDIIRVMLVDKKPLVQNTWWVAPGMADIPKEGFDKFDTSAFSKPKYNLTENETSVCIETSLLKVVFDLNSMKATWTDKKTGNVIAKDRITQNYNIKNSLGDGVFHYLQRDKNEQYYGLGERAGKTDRHGKRFKMLNVDPMGYDAETTDPLYKHVPFYITRNKTTGISFGIFYDNMSTCEFDLGNELDNYHGFYKYYTACDGDLDYYIILGPTVGEVTKKFSWLTGKTIMPPKWSIGYSGSTMTYTDAPDAQSRLQEFLDLCKKHNIPCDSFQLSSGYTSIADKRYVFNWNYDKFPDPKAFTDSFHKDGVRLCANIKPCLLHDHPMFEELDKQNMFVRSCDNKESEMCQFWDELGAYVDFTNPKSYDWWKNNVKKQLLDYGIDSTWNDNNEYEVWDKQAKVFGFGNELNIEKVKPLQTMLMMKASYEAQKEHSPNVRPYLISRSGSPGMQRYVQTWSGDNRTDWKTIRFNIKMGIGLSLSGIYNLGHDIGGFAGNAPEPELFVRWVQNGVFHPRFTIHSWNDDKTVNEPWMYKDVLPHVRSAIQLRSKFTPFIYDLMHKSATKYEPIIRPTFYNFESDEKTFEENDEFMLSDCVLVSSVVEKGQTEREVYLPKTSDGWYEYNTSKFYDGGQTVVVDAKLDTLPFFIRGGSVIPVRTGEVSFQTKDDDERGLLIYPFKKIGSNSFSFYEDDGFTNDFEKGIFTNLEVLMQTDENNIFIEIKKVGSYELPYKKIKLIVPSSETRNLIVNSNKVSNEGYINL